MELAATFIELLKEFSSEDLDKLSPEEAQSLIVEKLKQKQTVKEAEMKEEATGSFTEEMVEFLEKKGGFLQTFSFSLQVTLRSLPDEVNELIKGGFRDKDGLIEFLIFDCNSFPSEMRKELEEKLVDQELKDLFGAKIKHIKETNGALKKVIDCLFNLKLFGVLKEGNVTIDEVLKALENGKSYDEHFVYSAVKRM